MDILKIIAMVAFSIGLLIDVCVIAILCIKPDIYKQTNLVPMIAVFGILTIAIFSMAYYG